MQHPALPDFSLALHKDRSAVSYLSRVMVSAILKVVAALFLGVTCSMVAVMFYTVSTYHGSNILGCYLLAR